MRTFPLGISIILFILFPVLLRAQKSPFPTAQEVLERSMRYHDPQGNWERFEGSFYLQGKLPAGKQTYTVLNFNNEYAFYKATRKINGKMVTGGVKEGACFAHIDGNPRITADEVENFHLECEEILEMRNYHQQMVGLPMKLQEKGIHLHPTVTLYTFQGIKCFAVKASYGEENPTHGVWHYYFDRKTFALKGYSYSQASGIQGPGEYVVLNDELTIDGIRIPRVRKWYTNEHTLMGTDNLMDGKYLREADRMVLSRGQ